MNKIIIVLLLVILSINLGCQCDGLVNSYISYEKYNDADKFNVGSIKYNDNIETLNINWKAGNVRILKSSDNNISIEESETLEEKQKVRSIIKNGELIIHFWESGLTSKVKSEKKSVKIYVPEGINIYTSSTSAEIYCNIGKANNVEVNTTSGSIELCALECNNLSLSSTSGEIEVDDISSREVKIEATSGEIETAKVEASFINLSSTSGKIEAESLKAENIICSSTSGEIDIDEVISNICEVKNTSGGVYVCENASEKLNIETTSGNIDVFLDDCKEYNLKTTSGGVKLGILPSSSGKIIYKTNSGSFKTGGMQVLFDGTCYQIGQNSEKNITVNTKSGSLKLYEVK